MRRKLIVMIITVVFIAASAGLTRADDDALWTTVTTPDALIILDLTGSMSYLPQGGTPTLYLHGANNCSSNSGPFYTLNTGPDCLGTTSLYTAGNVCTSNGPYTVTNPSVIPTGKLFVAGSTCTSSYNGPYGITKTSAQCLNLASNTVWATTSTCTSSSAVYYISSGTGHTKSCTISNMPDTTYISNSGTDCATGPFYKTSASGRTTTCKKTCTECNNPFSGAAAAYTESDCEAGPAYYRSSGTGHTVSCPASVSCNITSNMYSEGDCTTGPFYKSSGAGHTTACYYNCNNPCVCNDYYCNNYGGGSTTANIPWSATDDCTGPFYTSSGTGHTANCSKIAIAKRAMFDLLDDNNDGTINSSDFTSLGMRLGLMRYYNCSGQDNDTTHMDPWNYGCIKLSWSMTQNDNSTQTPYANIYCNNTSCTSVDGYTSGHESIAGFSVSNGTPLAESLLEGRKFLDYHKGLDASASCRQKSIILITDGEDTYSCPDQPNNGCGKGSTTCISQRRAPVYYAYQAAKQPTNYNVYVVGFGTNMTDEMQNTLNWMAYYGGTRNPKAEQTVVDPANPAVKVNASSACGTDGTDPGSKTLRGYAFMASNPAELASSLRSAITSIQESTYSFSSQASVTAARTESDSYIYEVSFEPKNPTGIEKEPFWTGHLKKYQIGYDGSVTAQACWDAGKILSDTNPDTRNIWTLKNGAITDFNTTNITAADLKITGTETPYPKTVASVVGFYRGESAYNIELVDGKVWKLGDLFHTNPAPVKTPSNYFFDPRECGATSYTSYNSSNQRTPASGKQLMIVGGNDGQVHAFKTGDSSLITPPPCNLGGEEVWSFIPPNLLQKLAPISHNIHSTDIDIRNQLSAHDFFIDGPIQVSDVWLPGSWSGESWTPGSWNSGVNKTSDATAAPNYNWRTILTFGQGIGSGDYLWSASSNCYRAYNASDAGGDYTGFGSVWSVAHPYYCGFYALDITDSTTNSKPKYLWHLKGNASPPMTLSEGSYLGQAWSKMQTGRIRDGNDEKWVGFIGGGYSNPEVDGTPGRGFYVIDLRNGSILWKFTHGNTATSTTSPDMDYPMPAAPTPVDLDNDGFIDTVYLGDLGGNIWRFRLCAKDPSCSYCGKTSVSNTAYTASPCTSCTTASWTGSRLFASTDTERGLGLSVPSKTHKQIFTMVKAALDDKANVWVFFGTGQNNDPTWKPPTTPTAVPDTSSTKNRLYAIKEDTNWEGNTDFTATYTSADLTDITNTTYEALTSTSHGWYINLSTRSLTASNGDEFTTPVGEKMISDPTIFGGEIWFPTYLPDQGGASACGLAGYTFLYKINYLTGGGQWNDNLAKAAAAAYAAAKSNPGDTTIATAAKQAADNTINYRTKNTGIGIGSSILVSYGTDFKGDTYGTTSGGAGTAALTQNMGDAKTGDSMTKILYWKDKRVE